MSRVSKSQQDSLAAEFVSVTGASSKEASSFLKKHTWRLDAAIDAYYSGPGASGNPAKSTTDPATMEKRIVDLFNKYKDRDVDEISIDGTIKFCEDLDVNPEDVVLLAVAYELKSPGVGTFPREGWVEGWKKLQCDSIPKIKAQLAQLNSKLANDTEYLQAVYNFTFDFAKNEGQRSISIETAIAFWGLLLPAGQRGQALRHMDMITDSTTGDVTYQPSREPGWKPEYNAWWFEYLNEKGGKGISKDTWQMFFDFMRTIDAKFQKHDVDAAWPSAIDEFAERAKERVK